MKTIGIKLADGSFYPILEEGQSKKCVLDLTTAKDNQDEVHVDLYRFDQSEDGEILNEEYVDTITVPNVNPQPNGEPNFQLSIGIDENNELSAEVVNGETGEKHEKQVKLEPRSPSELGNIDDFSVAPSEFDIENDDSNDFGEELSMSDMTINDLGITNDSDSDETSSENDDFSLPDFDETDSTPSEESTSDSIADDFDTSALDDFNDTSSNSSNDDFLNDISSMDVPDFDSSISETESTEKHSDFLSDLDLPDFDSSDSEGKTTETFDSNNFDFPDFDSSDSESETTETFDSNNFDFPDFDDQNKTALKSSDPFDDPDFNFDDEEKEDDEEKKSGIPIFICILCVIICILITLFLLFKFNVIGGESKTEVIENTTTTEKTEKTEKETSRSSLINAIEEADGNSTNKNATSSNSSEQKLTDAEIEKATKLAEEAEAARKAAEEAAREAENAKKAAEEAAKLSENAQNENSAPEAVEDKIVIAPDASKVVPVSKPELTIAKEDVKHRVKWGDTLWDISETYYKNPWRYPRIAKHNKLKNPDVIIAGSDLMIPYE